MTPRRVTVTVPATSANLGPGFDAVGIAWNWLDEIEITRLDGPGLEFELEGEGADSVPRTEAHLVIRSVREAMGPEHARTGLRLRARSTIPHGRGLGSSAAAVVAGAAAGRVLAGLDEPGVPDRAALLTIGQRAEGHPDNVAPAVFGGARLGWAVGDGARSVELTTLPDLAGVVVVPDFEVPTAEARRALPERVPRTEAVATAGRSALLVHALAHDLDLLPSATEDWLHQPYRASLMRGAWSLVERLRADGWAAVISGAGPTVVVLGPREAMARVARRADVAEWPDSTPVRVREVRPANGVTTR